MTEHLHDPDLVFDLAAGAPPVETDSATVAAVMACERCSADLAMQRDALAALAALPAAHLEPTERDRLHAGLLEGLGLEDVPADSRPIAATKRRWRPVWGLATAAAVFLAIVAVPPAFRALSPSGESDMFTAASETTIASKAAAGDADAESSRIAAAPESAQPIDDAAAGDAASTFDTENAADETSIALPYVSLATTDDLSAERNALDDARSLGTGTGRTTLVPADTIAACRASIDGGEDGYPVGVTDIVGTPALLMAYPEDTGLRLVAHALSDCAVLSSAGG